MSKPDKKIVRCRFNEIDDMKEKMACFGYEQEECISSRNDVNVKLVFVRRDINNVPRVRLLERQYDIVTRLSFVGTITMVIIAAIFIAAYFIAKAFTFRVIFLYIGIPCVGIALLLFITRLILFLSRKKYVDYLLKEAQKCCGNSRSKPTPDNILPEEESSNLIKNNIKQVNKR